MVARRRSGGESALWPAGVWGFVIDGEFSLTMAALGRRRLFLRARRVSLRAMEIGMMAYLWNQRLAACWLRIPSVGHGGWVSNGGRADLPARCPCRTSLEEN